MPNLFSTEDPDWSCEGNTIEIGCDYRFLLDNLMDLTHETYVHGASNGHSAILDAPFDVTKTKMASH